MRQFATLLLFMWIPMTVIADEFRIGLRANRGIDQALQHWQATADYLNQQIPQHHFTLIPYENNSALNEALSRADFDFVLTNAASHVEHAKRYGVRPIATLVNNKGGKPVSKYGSVIFTQAGRDEINSLEDLRGMSFMGVDELGFGGWRAAWYEMLQHGIDPYKEFSLLSFGGGQQQRVVAAVLNGKADAGSVRTGLLERMAAEGELDLNEIKVINSKQTPGIEFLHSTKLYPEWPFATLKHVPEDIVREIALKLYDIEKTSDAARFGKYFGWTLPHDYNSVEKLIKELRVGPYVNRRSSHIDMLERYWVWLASSLLMLSVVLGLALYFRNMNNKLNHTQARLVNEIQSRRSAEEILHRLALRSTAGQNDEDFLRNCVKDLAAFYDTKYAFVGLYADATKTSIQTRAIWVGDGYADNYEYDLKGTPCADILNNAIEIIPQNAAELYPDDQILIDMKIDSYYGMPLVTSSGEVLGLVSVMDVKPLDPENWARDVLGVFANRIATEIARLNVERELKGIASELSYLASHDSLTALINRREFERRMESVLAATLSDKREHAFLYLDLDQFKIVNDTCGHAAGDELLRQLTLNLQKHIRGSDTLARLGGDEFGVLLMDCPLQKANVIADNIRQSIRKFRFNWENKTFEIGVSIGLVIIDQFSGSLKRILNSADSACYIAKENGRNRIHVFQMDDEELAKRSGEIQWASRISEALSENRLQLFRQDILPVSGEPWEFDQFEILLRYTDDNGNVVTPGNLIAAAERYNLILAIDKWVISQAFKYLAGRYSTRQLKTGDCGLCHINISGTSLNDDRFQRFISESIKRHNLPPKIICLEITETAAITNLAKTSVFIKELRSIGVRFALDDFGSGMSSFTYLKNMPVDFLKIDGHFVRDVSRDEVHRTMLKSIHQIGSVMKIKTIAEHVESEEARRVLEMIGIDLVQGYAMNEPIPLKSPVRRMTLSTRQRS